MIEYFVPKYMYHSDLFPIHYGMEDCKPGHFYGPAVRDHYLLHFVTRGHGKFQVGGLTYSLREGQGFLIYPDSVTYYEADKTTPWSYVWIGFNGLLAESLLHRAELSPSSPIFDSGKDRSIQHCIQSMISMDQSSRSIDIQLTAALYEIIAALLEYNPVPEVIEPQARDEQYAAKVVRFIEMNFANKITVADIANSIGLNRSYLNSIFRRQMQTNIQDYLIRYRLQRACQLMHNESLSIGHISRSVGYEDPLQFSKIFKKYYGMSPSDYRKQNRQ